MHIDVHVKKSKNSYTLHKHEQSCRFSIDKCKKVLLNNPKPNVKKKSVTVCRFEDRSEHIRLSSSLSAMTK